LTSEADNNNNNNNNNNNKLQAQHEQDPKAAEDPETEMKKWAPKTIP